MLTALEFLKIKRRMLEIDDHIRCCRISCDDCQLNKFNNGTGVRCGIFETLYPEKAIEIVEQWGKDHPVKTRKDDLFEKYPYANPRGNYTSGVCAKSLGYPAGYCGSMTCEQCWNTPLE